MMSPKASSKKTRIETETLGIIALPAASVRRRVPKKQGLKLDRRLKRIASGPASEGEFQKNKD